MKKICIQCGAEFEAKRSDARFCNDTCRVRHHRGNSKQIDKICSVCNKKFLPKHGHEKYCSDECREIGYEIAEFLNRLININILSAVKNEKCDVCGRELPDHALDLHHIDESSKKYQPAQLTRSTRNILLNELVKCIVVCPTCHRILHHGYKTKYTINGVKL